MGIFIIAKYINVAHNLSIVVRLGDSLSLLNSAFIKILKHVPDRQFAQNILYMFSSNPDTKSRSQRTSFSRA